jgi:hypothetical protein
LKTRTGNNPLGKLDQRDEEKRHEELGKLIQRYVDMHEVSRHVIHISETLAVASKTMTAVVAAQEAFIKERDIQGLITPSGSTRNVQHMRLSANFLANSQLRAQAFVQRLENEIQLVAIQDLSTQIES